MNIYRFLILILAILGSISEGKAPSAGTPSRGPGNACMPKWLVAIILALSWNSRLIRQGVMNCVRGPAISKSVAGDQTNATLPSITKIQSLVQNERTCTVQNGSYVKVDEKAGDQSVCFANINTAGNGSFTKLNETNENQSFNESLTKIETDRNESSTATKKNESSTKIETARNESSVDVKVDASKEEKNTVNETQLSDAASVEATADVNEDNQQSWPFLNHFLNIIDPSNNGESSTKEPESDSTFKIPGGTVMI